MSRGRFFFNLGALGAAILLIVAAAAFGPGAVKGMGLGIGIGALATSLLFVSLLVHDRRPKGRAELRFRGRRFDLWAALAGGLAAVAAWEVVQAAVFGPNVSRWLTLANGLLIGAFACAGLVAHEISTERVVHVLEVVERPPQGIS
jgi:hypothetical protein